MEHPGDRIVFAQTLALDPTTAAALSAIGRGIDRLEISVPGDGDHDLFIRNEVFQREVAFIGDDPASTLVGERLTDLLEFLGYQLATLGRALEQTVEVLDELLQFVVFLTQLAGFECSQPP